jgi:hypothetical protein
VPCSFKAPIESILASLFVLAGVALLFVRVDSEKLREKIHTNPMLAWYRFRVFRYGAAAALLVLAAVAFFGSSR